MKTYHFDPEKLKKQTKILILMYTIPLVIMLVLVYFLNRNRPEMTTQTIILVVLMIGFYGFMGYKRYKQNVQLWKEYALTIDEEGVSQNQPNYPEVRIPKADISGIEEVKNGFYVQTKSQGRVLGISKELPDADYEEIKQILSAWVTENQVNQSPEELETPEKTMNAEAEKALETEKEAIENDLAEMTDDLETDSAEAIEESKEDLKNTAEEITDQE